MASICFVGNEFHPTTPGGAGVFTRNITLGLLQHGHEVILLLNISKAQFERFDRIDRLQLPNHENCRAYHVEALCAQIPYKKTDFLSRYHWEAFRYDFACRQVYELEKPNLIEFVDYNGPAYNALCAKISLLSYQETKLAVRLHLSNELVDRETPSKPIDFDRYTAYALERHSLRLADSVLHSTASYIKEYYGPLKGTWFGETILSPPLPTNFPKRKQEAPDANIVLFYGRLFAWKGTNRFVDAAVSVLTSDSDSNLQYYLVGYDSMEPPVSGPKTYKGYLSQKIPSIHRKHFTFTGFLSHEQLQNILPQVKFAVIPSHIESYCFAAHELRQAGIPLILSDIPVFRENFQHEKDVLFFNGRASDLARQIERLDSDKALRNKLSQSILSSKEDELSVYQNHHDGWITTTPSPTPGNLLVCIIDDNLSKKDIARTLESLGKSSFTNWRAVIAKKTPSDKIYNSSTWLFGGLYTFQDQEGQSILWADVHTKNALLILRAGDEVSPEYLSRSLDILSRQPQISFVGSWKWIYNGHQQWLQTHPFSAMLELAPFETQSPFNRCVMRTLEGELLVDLFDQRANILTEVAYLWSLDDEQRCGIQIPEPMVWQKAEVVQNAQSNFPSYLIMQDRSRERQTRLAHYLAMLASIYPQPLLPLQAAWAQKSGFPTTTKTAERNSFIVRQGWRRRLVIHLSTGGKFSQLLLRTLSWVWFRIKALR